MLNSATTNELLNTILEAAEKAGLKEGELAQRAGISPVGLSKAKQRGDLRVSTLLRLAAVVELDVTLQPVSANRDDAVDRLRRGELLR